MKNRSWTRSCGLLLAGCLTFASAAFAADEKDPVYGHSDLFSKEDMDSAVELILEKFNRRTARILPPLSEAQAAR